MRWIGFAIMSLLALSPAPLWADAPTMGAGAPRSPSWVTLGTMGGPMPFAGRSQPANALMWEKETWLIDCGDGAVGQLAKAGLSPRSVTAVYLSHLHFDHTGGIAALIGLRYQTNVPGKLAIYGPPGTRAMVDGILASMRPASQAGYGLPGEPMIDPAETVSVRELAGEEKVTANGVTVRWVKNSHYSFEPGSAKDLAYQSFSYRFDLPDRSILYTGDTGPSAAVEQLGSGVDLLVSEMIDVEATVAAVHRMAPDQTDAQIDAMRRHLTDHHLSPEQVGDLALRMNAKRVVVTHLAGPTGTGGKTDAYSSVIARLAKVQVTIANDLDRF